jgi:hypothetical protein
MRNWWPVFLAGPLLQACGVTEPSHEPHGEGICAERGTSHSGAITASATWAPEDGPHHVSGTITIGSPTQPATLTILPGAVVCLAASAAITTSFGTPGQNTGGVLLAAGTATAPITFTANVRAEPWDGITISELNPPGKSHVSHAVVEHASQGITGRGPIDIEHAVIRHITGTAIVFWYYNAGSRIAHTRVDSAGRNGEAAIYMEGGLLEATVITGSSGAGLLVNARLADVRIIACDVLRNAGDGIVVLDRTVRVVRINDCNLEHNAGLGVRNHSQVVADATRNWWGDPEGPTGPAGDGVSARVDYSGFRTTPRLPAASPATVP